MSRIGKVPVPIPDKVKVAINGETVLVEGPKGKVSKTFSPVVKIVVADKKVTVAPVEETRFAGAMYGTARSIIAGMVKGVTEGFEKKLTLIGVGFKAAASGNKLNLNVGFSHPVDFVMPAGVTVACPTPTEIVIKGADRQVVGQLAADIRAVRPPEPYKGKGIRYAGEKVTIKETKKK